MKFCTSHWDALRAAVIDAGLGHFIPTSGQEAIRRLADGVETNENTRSNFDPLMGAHNSIVSNVLKTAGLGIFGTNADGSEICPLCLVIDRCPCGLQAECSYQKWIGFAVRDEVDEAKAVGGA